MLEIDVTSNVEEVLAGIDDFFRGQVPFVTSQALNDTAFDIRRRIVESTWDNAFEVRNRRFPGVIFRVDPKATKASQEAVVQAGLSYPWVAEWLERQATGGTKRPATHNWVAVPLGKPKRNSNGSIPKGQKPLNLKNTFVRSVKGGGNRVILERKGRGESATVVARYLLIKQADIKKTFRFEEDATETALRVFSGHWSTRLSRVIARSRVFSG